MIEPGSCLATCVLHAYSVPVTTDYLNIIASCLRFRSRPATPSCAAVPEPSMCQAEGRLSSLQRLLLRLRCRE